MGHDDAGGATTIDDVLNDTAEAHPEPVAQAPQIVADVMQQPTPAAGQRDRKGTLFDPSKHTGDLTARGTWRKLRSARAVVGNGNASEGGAHASPVLEPSALGDVSTPQIEIDTRAVAQSWLDGLFVTLPMILGEEWKPSKDERDNLTDALERYMVAAGITYDLPPGWALLLALGVYILPRCTMPKTKERVGAIAGRIKSLVGRKEAA